MAYGLVGLGLLGLLVSTPFVLAALAPASVDWGKLSDVSRTYGAVSVVLAALAPGGVAFSLLYPVRQARTASELGHLPLEKLAVKLDGHFSGEIAREQWDREDAGWRRTMEAGDRRDRVFVRLVDERYHAAVAGGPASALLQFQDRHKRSQGVVFCGGSLGPSCAGILRGCC